MSETHPARRSATDTTNIATYPLDLIRSRISIASAAVGHASNAELTQNSHLGLLGMSKRVIEEGGFRGLYRGVTLTALGVAPCSYQLLQASCPVSDLKLNLAM